jgi:peptidoglycan/LPS O-acetylase OafA/YrhL
MKNPSRFTFIDALRGLASLSVVLFHLHAGSGAAVFSATLPQFIQTILKHGYLGVQVFFVLSGFVIAYSLRNVIIDFAYFRNFVLRRLIRLSPPYWAAIALVIFLRYVSNFILADRVAALPSWQQLVAHIFYLQDLLGLGNMSAVFWTLCIEIQFYLIFCALLAVAQRLQFIRNFFKQSESSTILLTFGSASLLAAAWPVGVVSKTLGTALFLPNLYMFLLGAFIWWTLEKKMPFFCFTFYLLIIFAGAVINGEIAPLFAVLITVLIYIVGKKGRLRHWFNLGWLQYLGQISYSLYLTHTTVSLPILNLGYRITKNSVIGSFLWFLIALIVSFVTAHFWWKLIEKPSVEFSKRFKLIVN